MLRKWAAALLFSAAFSVSANAAERPLLAIIIDDLGDNFPEGHEVVELPAPVTCAFLPRTPYAKRLALVAHARGKEVMLHLPMESGEGNRLGPGGLTIDMTREEFHRTVADDLAAVPFVRGVNNHMGSLLTRAPGSMAWLMAELKAAGGLFFVDSRTAAQSVAYKVALEYGLPTTDRDVFLDNQRTFTYISGQLLHAVAVARRTGAAIAIGHGHPETLAALQQLLPHISQFGVKLVPASAVVKFRTQRRIEQWQASLSPLPTAAKNSKP